MRNISSITAAHINPFYVKKQKNMVVTVKQESCPLQDQYLTPKVIYEAAVVNASDEEKRVYFGSSDTTFKEGYRNHT